MNKSLVSWVLYDVANTIFNLGVVGLFLPLSINEIEGTTDADLGFPIAISMLIVLLASPFLGALTDQLKGRIKTFTLLNIGASLATCLIGFTTNLQSGLIFFSVAFVCVYLAELLYNSMLVEASDPENRGLVGGLAIGIGYFGALAVTILALQHDAISSNYGSTIQLFGIMFILTAIPMSIFFVEKVDDLDISKNSLITSTWIQIKRTWDHFKEHPNLLKFFIARYFYMTTITTGSTFAVLYGLKTIGFTEREVELVLLLGILVAIPSSVIWGFIVDKIGPFKTLKLNLLGWAVIMAGSLSIPWMDLSTQLWWPLGAITGAFFGGLWVADRPLLIQLSPTKLGEMFGIYGAISRLAFLTGAIIWPFVAVNLDLGQPTSVFILLCSCLMGLVVLMRFQNHSTY